MVRFARLRHDSIVAIFQKNIRVKAVFVATEEGASGWKQSELALPGMRLKKRLESAILQKKLDSFAKQYYGRPTGNIGMQDVACGRMVSTYRP
jgi:hypothetical protein